MGTSGREMWRRKSFHTLETSSWTGMREILEPQTEQRNKCSEDKMERIHHRDHCQPTLPSQDAICTSPPAPCEFRRCFFFFLVCLFVLSLFIFQLKDNYFTEFCFLSYLTMNQPWLYIYSLPFELPLHLPPPPPLKVDTEPLFEFPKHYRKFLLAIYFTWPFIM